MANTLHGPFVKGASLATGSYGTGVGQSNTFTSGNANNDETQAGVALHSFNPHMIGAGFVLSGAVCTKDGVNANQLDIASGEAYLIQSDGTPTLCDIAADTTHTTTGNPSTTMYLDLNPDGSWSWGTSHSAVTNHLTICSVTTDASANIATVVDARPLNPALLPTLAGVATLPSLNTVVIKRSLGGATQDYLWVWGPDSPVLWKLQQDTSGDLIWYDAVHNAPVVTIPWTSPMTIANGLITGHIGVTAGGDLIDTSSNSGTGPTGTTAMYLKAGGAGNGVNVQIPNGTTVMQIQPSGFANIGGQAAVGFGVPVIVAQALGVHVTVTSLQVVLSFNVTTTGLYRVNLYAYIRGSGNPSSISASLHWTEPTDSSRQASFFSIQSGNAGNVNPMTLDAASVPTANIAATFPAVIYAASGATIVVDYTNATATPNDNVSTLIERLA